MRTEPASQKSTPTQETHCPLPLPKWCTAHLLGGSSVTSLLNHSESIQNTQTQISKFLHKVSNRDFQGNKRKLYNFLCINIRQGYKIRASLNLLQVPFCLHFPLPHMSHWLLAPTTLAFLQFMETVRFPPSLPTHSSQHTEPCTLQVSFLNSSFWFSLLQSCLTRAVNTKLFLSIFPYSTSLFPFSYNLIFVS